MEQQFAVPHQSKDGGRGFTGDVIIFDGERSTSTRIALSAILPTLSNKPNPHIYFFSSAGKASHESDVLRELKARGEKGDGFPGVSVRSRRIPRGWLRTIIAALAQSEPRSGVTDH
jgi:hypothetical protein